MSIHTEDFGKLATGENVTRYTLHNRNGMSASFITYGAILTSLQCPDRQGSVDEITLGFDDLGGYVGKHPYFGATVGRYANRIGKATFSLDGNDYPLAPNDGDNHLHGGNRGYDKVLWHEISTETAADGDSVTLAYTSPDGEEGYPGTVDIQVTYTLGQDNRLSIHFTAVTDKATPINMTNHTYFNLAGAGTILNHTAAIFADGYTPVGDNLIPTGEISPVAGTPLDFTEPQRIGSRIGSDIAGYDHNFVIKGQADGTLRRAAIVTEPVSGRCLNVSTTEPGIQFYSGNFLDGSLSGRGGAVYEKHDGFCLEPQKYPDSPNQPSFPDCVLRPGETYNHTIEFALSVVD